MSKELRWDALVAWLADGARPSGLMDPAGRHLQIAALCNDIRSKVGTGRGQLPSKAKHEMNWSLMLWSRQIKEKGIPSAMATAKAGKLWHFSVRPSCGCQRNVQ